jgi:hypothetical protein
MGPPDFKPLVTLIYVGGALIVVLALTVVGLILALVGSRH